MNYGRKFAPEAGGQDFSGSKEGKLNKQNNKKGNLRRREEERGGERRREEERGGERRREEEWLCSVGGAKRTL
jgi:hypothetical protein